MTTAIDSNVIIALWDRDLTMSSATQTALEAAFHRGGLVIAAPVFAALLAAPGRTEAFVESFLKDIAIAADWNQDEMVWRAAGRALQRYAERRRKQHESGTRWILADFMTGAHAETRGHRLLTRDERVYRAAVRESFDYAIADEIHQLAADTQLVRLGRSTLASRMQIP